MLVLCLFFLVPVIGCDEVDRQPDDTGGSDDDQACTGMDFLVTQGGCGPDGLGELTEVCIDEKWEEHSCNDPADWPDHNYTSGYIAGCSGQIHYQKWAQKSQAAANLVFLNGRTEYVDKYHHLIPLLSRQWDIVMFDHYGQGRSGGPRAHADDFDTQHVCDFTKVLEETTNPQIPTFVMTHSMGGFVAVRHEELHPGSVDALVMSAPMLGLDSSPFTLEQAINMAASAIEEGKGEDHYKDNYARTDCDEWKLTHDCDLYEQFRYDELTIIGYSTYGWLYAALTGMQKALDDAEKITIPVLVFQAELDNTVLPEPQNEFCAGLADCELVVREGDYHDMFCELDREDIVEESLEFFDEILKTL